MREFYSQKAAECLLASRRVHRPADKNALLHMAATYIELAVQMELGKERGHEISEHDPPLNGTVQGLVGIEGAAAGLEVRLIGALAGCCRDRIGPLPHRHAYPAARRRFLHVHLGPVER